MMQVIDFSPLPAYQTPNYDLQVTVAPLDPNSKRRAFPVNVGGGTNPELVRDVAYPALTRWCQAVKVGQYGILVLDGARVEVKSNVLPAGLLPQVRPKSK